MNIDVASLLRIWPDRALSTPSEPVTMFDDELTQTVIDFFEALKELKGLGLSACQLGDMRQIFVCKVEDKERVFINPSIKVQDLNVPSHEAHEGCLSIPGAYVKVKRWNRITVNWVDTDNTPHEEAFEGQLADVIQHEYDHLCGRTILSYLSRLKRDITTRKMNKLVRKIQQLEQVRRNVRKRMLDPTSVQISA